MKQTKIVLRGEANGIQYREILQVLSKVGLWAQFDGTGQNYMVFKGYLDPAEVTPELKQQLEGLAAVQAVETIEV